MSNQLSTSYPGAGAHLYCVVRTITGAVWNLSASAFESPPSDAALIAGDYSIDLADRGMDLYSADMPSAIPTGTYRIFYYERAGASPATSDVILKTPLRFWDGTALDRCEAGTEDVIIVSQEIEIR